MPPPFTGEPYLSLFYESLTPGNIDLVPAQRYGLTWFRSHGRSVDAFHFHWLHLFYDRPGALAAVVGWIWLCARLLALRLGGWGLIWTAHNLESHERKHPWLDHAAGWLMARIAHVVMAHGEVGARRVSERFGRADVVRLPLFSHHGHYPQTIDRASAREQLGLPAEAFVIVLTGKLRAYKGADVLIEAFRARARAGDRLVIAGRPETPAIAAQLEQAIGGDARVLLHARFVPDDELQVFYRAADLAVLPYRDILTSGVVGAALSFGVPVVAPRRGSLPEALADGAGVLYEPDSPGDPLWDAIEQVRASDRAPLASRALARSEELSFARLGEAAAPAIRERLARARVI